MIKFLKSQMGGAVLFVVLLTVVLVLLAYGIATHSEVGMMQVTPGWERSDFPLAVCPHTYGGETVEGLIDTEIVVGDAVLTTNNRLGFKAYEVTDTGCEIDVTVGAPAEAGWKDPGGNYIITRKHCEIETVNVHGEIRDLVLQHELGHCLGLAHDDFELSIMRLEQFATAERQLPPWITDSDKDMLRAAFAPQ